MKQAIRQIYRKSPLHFLLRDWKSRIGLDSTILDSYVLKSPCNQNILDIFKGEWMSQLPKSVGISSQPGTSNLFEDERVVWTEKILGEFTNWRVLELGPLEGGHSYMFQNRNVNKIISIEANTRAFLKCLCIKEILKLDKVEFKLGDFMSFLREEKAKYDLVFASGVLYHMQEPVELLKLISKVSDKVFIWTHYYDKELISKGTNAYKFGPKSSFDYEGVTYEYASQSYKDGLYRRNFCGGPQPASKWLTRNSIMKALQQFGFANISTNFDQPDHPNGPAFAICVKK